MCLRNACTGRVATVQATPHRELATEAACVSGIRYACDAGRDARGRRRGPGGPAARAAFRHLRRRPTRISQRVQRRGVGGAGQVACCESGHRCRRRRPSPISQRVQNWFATDALCLVCGILYGSCCACAAASLLRAASNQAAVVASSMPAARASDAICERDGRGSDEKKRERDADCDVVS